jgi:hypothetical protein
LLCLDELRELASYAFSEFKENIQICEKIGSLYYMYLELKKCFKPEFTQCPVTG